MLEIAPGVYTAPKMNRAVRERVWAVLEKWFYELGGGGIVMTWMEPLFRAVSRSPCWVRHRTTCMHATTFF
jgi:CRISPR-associated endoribonuclease Cas2 subtype I-E